MLRLDKEVNNILLLKKQIKYELSTKVEPKNKKFCK